MPLGTVSIFQALVQRKVFSFHSFGTRNCTDFQILVYNFHVIYNFMGIFFSKNWYKEWSVLKALVGISPTKVCSNATPFDVPLQVEVGVNEALFSLDKGYEKLYTKK